MSSKIVRISDIINDCNLNLCVPTCVGESLASILKKICVATNEGSGSTGGCCYEFRNSNTIVFNKDGNIISAATISMTEFDAGNLAPLFTTSVATPTTTPFLSFNLNQQAANKVFAGPASGANNYPSFRLLQFDDLPFDVGDFIQNQFALPQVANYWIDGHARVDDYLQISNTSRLVTDFSGKLSITENSDSITGDDLRLSKLLFFSQAIDPPFAAKQNVANAQIYASDGAHLNLVSPFGSVTIQSRSIDFGDGLGAPTFSVGGFNPLIISAGDSATASDGVTEFFKNNVATINTVTNIGLSLNRENGVALNPTSNRGTRQPFATIGIQSVDVTQSAYKGDLTFNTVSALVNSGVPTEYLRLKYDGRIIASAYSTLLPAPATTGIKHMLTCDENGLFSHEAIGAGGVGSVTSVGLSMPSAFSVANSPITTAGTLVVTGAGTTSQVILGDGSLGQMSTVSAAISSLTSALNTNTISNSGFTQTWNWTGLNGTTGLALGSSSSINSLSGNTAILTAAVSGSNSSSNQTHAIRAINNAGGSTGNNIAIHASASGGSAPYSLYAAAGNIFLSGNPTTEFIYGHILGSLASQNRLVGQDSISKKLGYTTLGTGLTLSAGVLNTSTPISALIAATANNTINNGDFKQRWNWSNLSSSVAALILNSSGASVANGSTTLQIGYGSTTNSVETYAARIINSGVNSGSNVALYLSATAGLTNTALWVNFGDTRINDRLFLTGLTYNTSQDTLVGLQNSSGLVNKVGIGSGLTLSGGVLSVTPSGGGTPTWQETLTAGSTLTTYNEIDVNGTALSFKNTNSFDIKAETSLLRTFDPIFQVFAASVLLGDAGLNNNGTRIYIDDGAGGETIQIDNLGSTYLRIAAFGSASNGDVLTLVNNTTGLVGWTAGGGGGGVSSFSAGTLSPLFTTSVATATTTPALSFILTNAGAHSYFGNNTAGSAAPAYKSNAALTKTDDTNVTLTLGGAPTTSLLEATSLTLGWTGTLGVARGGTNIASYTAGDLIRATGATTLTKLAVGTANQLLRVNAGGTDIEWYTAAIGTGSVTDFSAGDLSPLFTTTEATTTSTPALSFVLTNAAANTYFGNATGGSTAPSYTAAGALTAVNDTNVLLTVGGNAATSLLRAASITASWNGTLSVARGGTNFASYGIGDILIATGATTLSKLAIGSVGQQLRVNGGGTSLEYFTAAPGITTLNTLTATTQLFTTSTSGTDFTVSSSVDTHTFNLPSASATNRGLVTIAPQTFASTKTFNDGVIINELGGAGISSDFRVESDTNTNALFVDSTNNRVGIFTAVPAFPFEVTGNTRIIGTVGIGTSPSTPVLTIGGSAGTDIGIYVGNTISTTVNSSPSLVSILGGIIESTSGTHAILSALSVSPPSITAGLATVTNAATVYISAATTAVGATNSALLVNSGTSRFNGNVIASGDFVLTTGNASTGAYDIIVRNQSTGRLEAIDGDSMGLVTYGTTSVTPILSDKGKYLTFTNAGAITFTVPTNILVPFPVGTTITLEQGNTGQITVVGGVGITVNASDGALRSRTQYSVMTLVKKSSITWTLSGDTII